MINKFEDSIVNINTSDGHVIQTQQGPPSPNQIKLTMSCEEQATQSSQTMFAYFEKSHDVNLEKFQKFCRQSQNELRTLTLD